MTWLPAARRGGDGRARRDADAAADVPHLVRGRAVRRSRRGRRRGPRPDRRDAHARRRGDGGRLDAVGRRRTCGPCSPHTRGREVAEPWAGGAFGERARCLLAPNPGLMTLDGTNTWVLSEPGASRSVVIDPGPIEDGHVDLLDEQTGDVAWSCSPTTTSTTPRPPSTSRPARAARCAPSTRRTASTRPARRRRGDRRRRAVPSGGHHARPHGGLDLSAAAVREGAALRRHGARPRYDGGRLPGRPAGAVLRLDRADALARRVRRGRHDLAGARPRARRRPRNPRVLPRPPPPAARPGRGRAGPARRRRPDADDEELPRRVVEIVYQDVDESLWGAAEWSVRAQLAYLAER